jgi:sugar-specific transcriptional regulator TrmB
VSQEKVLQTLSDLGLTRLDTQVYIYLAKKGPQKGIEISKGLKVQRQQLYRSLKCLQKKAIVSATLERPARFSAVPFEQVLDLFVKAKLQEAQNIQAEKNKLLSSWQTIQSGETPADSARFMVIEGRNIIYSRIKQMINETKKQLSIISPVTGLLRADRFGLLDSDFKQSKLSNVQFRLLTHVTKENANLMQAFLKEAPETDLLFEIRSPNLGLGLFPQMVIRDEEEVMFFINPKVDDALSDQDNLCLWTNSKSLLQAFDAVFEDLWQNSTNLHDRISEIELDKPRPKTCVLSIPDEAKKKYEETLHCAEKEIVLMTCSKGINEHLYRKSLEEWFKKGISIKIMTPVTSENWETVRKISKFCKVKHVPTGYPETTIVDNEHYFQFKTTAKEKTTSGLDFVDTFYTNDFEYVHKMNKLFEDLWKKAYSPSSVTLETILEGIQSLHDQPSSESKMGYLKPISGLGITDWKLRSSPAERVVLNKLLESRKLVAENLPNNVTRMHGSMGSAIVHPPDRFKLPDMLFTIFHVEKHSSFGEEDSMLISMRRETPKGPMFVPSAYVGDNPHAQSIWQAFMSGTPAGQNVQLFKKNEIQIQIHGNTLFVAWTKQISLFPPQYVLPPSCLMMEGYGDLKTDSYSMFSPSGYKIEVERNGFEAFVTFLHPESKYSGPGTDGFFARDYVSTVHISSVS